MLTRITKAEARKRFAANQALYVCPVKLHPFPPLSSAALVFGANYEPCEVDNSWKGEEPYTISAWDVMYNNWAYYNASWEAGYYASYWVESED